MPKVFTSKTQKIGKLGEKIACKYIISKGFTILDQNITKKYGEIDILAQKDNKIHFIEVKSVSVRDLSSVSPDFTKVPPGRYETKDFINPAEQMHSKKQERMKRMINGYLLSEKYEGEWIVDLVCVYIHHDTHRAKIKIYENIILF